MSTWSDIATVVGKAAPIIGTVLGGPLGAAAGGLVASALGVDNNADSVSAAIAADPQALEKIKEAELNAKVELQKLVVQAENNRLQAAAAQYQAEAGDRASARDLAAKQPSDKTRQNITYLFMALVAAIVSGMLFIPSAQAMLRDSVGSVTVGVVLGYVFNELKQILGFWFGATRDQSAQTQAITQFATSPGAVTTESGAPLKPPAEARDDLKQNWTQ